MVVMLSTSALPSNETAPCGCNDNQYPTRLHVGWKPLNIRNRSGLLVSIGTFHVDIRRWKRRAGLLGGRLIAARCLSSARSTRRSSTANIEFSTGRHEIGAISLLSSMRSVEMLGRVSNLILKVRSKALVANDAEYARHESVSILRAHESDETRSSLSMLIQKRRRQIKKVLPFLSIDSSTVNTALALARAL